MGEVKIVRFSDLNDPWRGLQIKRDGNNVNIEFTDKGNHLRSSISIPQEKILETIAILASL